LTSTERQILELKTSEGKLLQAFAGDSITQEIQAKGEYDGNTLDSLRQILSVIRPIASLDVGANIGNHAVIIADYSETLIAFEPVPFIFDLLKQNIDHNSLHHAYAVNIGLSSETMHRDIFIPEYGNLGCSSLEPIEAEGTHVQIETWVGDDYLAKNFPEKQIDFIKIDVEGHEPAALTGLVNTLTKYQPLVLMEYRNKSTLELFQDRVLFGRLFPGYHIYSLSNTASKKVYPSGLIGILRRWLAKLQGGRWCLSDFDALRRYSNIYLVPKRYQSLFTGLRHLSSK
jgi:FkbM family methyltransferase